MIRINLLSPKKKEEVKLKRIYASIKDIVMLFLLFALIISIMLLGSKFFLQNQLTELLTQNATRIDAVEKISKKIILANVKINGMEKIQNNFQKMSAVFEELANITPSGAYYSSVQIYRETGIIQLRGTASTRQDLLKLQDNLNNSELFQDIDLPLSDLLSKENNSFNISANIDFNAI